MDTWIAALVISTVILNTLLLGGAFFLLPGQDPFAAGCLLLPWFGWLVRRFIPLGTVGPALDAVTQGAAILLCFVLAMQSSLFFPLLIGMLAILSARRSRADDGAAASLVLAALSSAGLGAVVGNNFGLLLSFPILCLAATGLLWVQARHARRRVRRATAQQPEESLLGLRGRALIGCALGLMLLLLVPASFRTASVVQRTAAQLFGGEAEYESLVTQEREGRETGPRGRDRSTNRNRPSGTDESQSPQEREAHRLWRAQRVFPDALTFEGDTSMVPRPQSMRLELRVMQPLAEMKRFHRARPAYLVTTSFDAFGPSGLEPSSYDGLREYTDLADGVPDGWTQVMEDPKEGVLLDLQLIMSTLFAPGDEPLRTTVPRIEPLIAAFRPELRHRPSGMLTFPNDGHSVQQLRFRTRVPHRNVLELPRIEFDRSNPRFLRLPTDTNWRPVLAAARAQLKELDPNEPSLRAVLGHFKRGYQYSLSAPAEGVAGLEGFLEERNGYCTYFATSAMLMLRLMDVPSRVVAGYRVTEWDEERQAYVAGDQTGHAWVEVRVKDLGWMPIDPTPAAALELAVAQEAERLRRAEEAERLGAEGEPDDELEIAQEDQETDEPGEEEADDGAAAIAAESKPPKFNLGVIAATVTVLLLMLVRGLRTARRSEEGHPWSRAHGGAHAWTEADPVFIDDDSYRRVLKLLRQLGFLPGRQRTPLEFAHAKLRRRGDSFRPLLGIIKMLYAKRYGDQPMAGASWQYFLRYERAVNEAADRGELELIDLD